MNKLLRAVAFSTVASFAVAIPRAVLAQHRPGGRPPHAPSAAPPQRTLTTPPMPVSSPSKEIVKNLSGEQFFIIASIDRQNSQVLLKRPTEVTVLAKLSPNTKYLNDSGKPSTLANFRAGDTVWARLSGNEPEPTVAQMRAGEMTVADLHRYYLDYAAVK